MTRMFLWTVAAALVLAMTSCGGGSSAPPAPPPAPDYDFLTGTAQQGVTFDFRGSLPAGATLVTTEGIRLVVQPGTVVRTRRGTRLLGSATLGVDDSGGADAMLSPSALNGVVRTWVRVGANLVDAVFDPPATIELPLGDWSLPGGWTIGTNVQNRACVLGPDPNDLTGPGNEGDPVSLGVVDIDPMGLEQVPVEQAGPIGFLFVPHSTPTTLQAIVFSTSVVSFPVPGAPGAEWPKVYSWKLVNPDTADIVAIGTVSGGMGNGESQTVSYGGNTYTATLVSDGAGRRLEVTSNVNNVFRFELALCDEDGTGSQADGTGSGGSDGEADTGGTYAGAIEITIYGWGGPGRLRQHRSGLRPQRLHAGSRRQPARGVGRPGRQPHHRDPHPLPPADDRRLPDDGPSRLGA